MINWNKVDDIKSLFYQLLKILILSEDADAAYTYERNSKLILQMREADIPHSVERVVDFSIQDYE